MIGHVFRDEPLDSVQRTLREHGELIELLEQGNRDEVARLMGKHINAGRQLALATMDRAYMNSTPRADRAAVVTDDGDEEAYSPLRRKTDQARGK